MSETPPDSGPENPTYKVRPGRSAEGVLIHEYELPLEKGGSVKFGDFVGQRGGKMRHSINASATLGCTQDCPGCDSRSSKTPFGRLLTTDELIQQVMTAIEARKGSLPPDVDREVGFLGEGENTDNTKHLVEAIRALNKLQPPLRHVLLSTTGKKIKPFLDALRQLIKEERLPPGWLRLQYSLYHFQETVRNVLVPMRQPWNWYMDVVNELDSFAKDTGHPVIYNMPQIHGVTDTEENTRAGAAFFGGAPKKRKGKYSSFNGGANPRMRGSAREVIDANVAYLKSVGADVYAFHADVPQEDLAVNCGRVVSGERAGVRHRVLKVLA